MFFERTHKEYAHLLSTDELRQQVKCEQGIMDHIDENNLTVQPGGYAKVREFSVVRSKALIQELVDRSQ